MAQQYIYSAHALPSPRTSTSPPAELSALAHRYAALRLEALLTSPKAFGSTHAIESKFTHKEWTEMIWRKNIVVLVCVAHPAIQSEEVKAGMAGLDGHWVASGILRGPIAADEYALNGPPPTPISTTDSGTVEETRWQMTAVFASEAHRGRGLGKMLIQAGKDYAMAHTQTLGLKNPKSDVVLHTSTQRPTKNSSRLRVIIHPDNLAVLSLYSGMGFLAAGRTTGQEAYRTNGDLSSWELKLRTLTDEMKEYWKTAKVAVVMEWAGHQKLDAAD
ncbi:hypothetical protein C8F04DRAFT_1064342 [Mycena alexandri]|uniref:N-acetyltransferase domain-containing protein n=1 Tax=Mycena alexandri TaxID=1745969 RepID=A0AAD6TH32_9AGAR|nr:hypothetical protein C8F04DRAFT_1064342 [Mycena alexandri]